tara:strand:- start:37 stop:477 length:441 start_codon:yes stop_codon:yes gene_type:complete
MAIVNKDAQNWYGVDKDEDKFIGFTFPLNFDGTNPSKTTLEAVKQNVLNLCSTEAGERLMQPNLGVRLKRFLFEPYSDEIVYQVKSVVKESMEYWLPFVIINEIDVQMSDNETGDFRSTMEISINFSLKRDPSTHESVQIPMPGNI